MSREGTQHRRRGAQLAARPDLESLETRQLLSRSLPIPSLLPNVRSIISNRAAYQIQLVGPGTLFVQPSKAGGIGIGLLGTTDQSTLVITRPRVGQRFVDSALPIVRLDIRSGLLGAIQASGTADLLGPVTRIANPVADIQVRDIGPRARVQVAGNLGSLGARSINLGPGGLFEVDGTLIGPVRTGAINLQGGMFLVDQGLGQYREDINGNAIPMLVVNGALNVGPKGVFQVGSDLIGPAVLGKLQVNGGMFVVGRNLGEFHRDKNETGNPVPMLIVDDLLSVGGNGTFRVGGDMVGPVGLGALQVTGGQFFVTHDLTGPAIVGSLAIKDGGRLAVGNTFGPLAVTTDTIIANEGSLGIGATLDQLTVGRDLLVGPTGRIDVGTGMNGPIQVGRDLKLDGGPILIHGDVTGGPVDGQFIGLEIGRDALLNQGGRLVIDRDLTGPLLVGNNLVLATPSITPPAEISRLEIGRNATGPFLVNGNIDTSGVGVISIGGNISNLGVTGYFLGQGGSISDPPDLIVGLNMNTLQVLGKFPGKGGITNARIIVEKDLANLDVPNGVFNSTVTHG